MRTNQMRTNEPSASKEILSQLSRGLTRASSVEKYQSMAPSARWERDAHESSMVEVVTGIASERNYGSLHSKVAKRESGSIRIMKNRRVLIIVDWGDSGLKSLRRSRATFRRR